MPAAVVISKINGVAGDVRIGKTVVVGRFKEWTLVRGEAPGTFDFAGQLETVDQFLVTKTPDTLRLEVGPRQLRWQGVSLTIECDRVRATLVGAPEER